MNRTLTRLGSVAGLGNGEATAADLTKQYTPDVQTRLGGGRRSLGTQAPFASRPTKEPLDLYMDEIGKIALLKPAEEAEIGRGIEERQIRLVRAVAKVPFAVKSLLVLSTRVRQGQLPPNELVLSPDGRKLTQEDIDAMLTRFDHIRVLYRGILRLQRRLKANQYTPLWSNSEVSRMQGAIEEAMTEIPLSPERIDTLLGELRDMASKMESLAHENCSKRGSVMKELRKLEVRAGFPHHKFMSLMADIEEKDEAVRELKNRMFQANLRLVVATARRYLGRGQPLSDLIQEGNIGLMKAVNRFQYRRGFKFSNYAIWWIRHEILRGIAHHARTIRIPVYMLERIHQLMRVSREVVNELGREPTTEELADRAGISLEEVGFILDASKRPVSLETPTVEDLTIGDSMGDKHDSSPDDVLLGQDLSTHVALALNGLSPREKEIIRSRFGLEGRTEQTLEDLATRFSLSRERIRQIEAAALGKLRTCMAGEALRTFVEN